MNVRVKTIFAIRDARGLSIYEKAVLFTVASRGRLTTTVERAAEDACMSVRKFQSVKRALQLRGLLEVEVRPGRTSAVTVNLEALQREEQTLSTRCTPEEMHTPGTAYQGGLAHGTKGGWHSVPGGDSTTCHPKETRKGIHKGIQKGTGETTLRIVSEKPSIDLPRTFTEEQVRQILNTAVQNRRKLTDLTLNITSTPVLYSWGDAKELDRDQMRKYLHAHPGELRDLVRELPENEVATLLESFATPA